jgi:hypothetical protein
MKAEIVIAITVCNKLFVSVNKFSHLRTTLKNISGIIDELI